MAATVLSSSAADMKIAVCLKWVDIRPEIDPLTGAVSDDPRWFGASAADQAALEWGLRIADATQGELEVVTAGPAGADDVLRAGLAVGATSSCRIEIDMNADSAQVAAALASVLGPVDLVLCGDWSLDRGSGSVPAFLAHHLGAAQALGCTTVGVGSGGRLEAERRLDRGRRERLRVPAPAVISMEGGSAELRRASMKAMLSAASAAIKVQTFSAAAKATTRTGSGPFRPRPRRIAAPEGDSVRERLVALIGANSDHEPPRARRLDPTSAADELLAQLASWGVEPIVDEP